MSRMLVYFLIKKSMICCTVTFCIYLFFTVHNFSVEACYPLTFELNSTVDVQRSVTEERVFSDEATLTILVLLSILAVLTVGALILCYLRKRPITHLSKQGIFGRFPNEAAGLHKSPETEALRQKGTFDGDRACDAGRSDVWQTVQSSLGVNIFCK